MTQEELDAIRARVNAATPGPWKIIRETDEYGRALNQWQVDALYPSAELADAEFVAAALADVPALLDEIARLKAYADKLADALPAGGLPQDIETRRAANVALAQENHELRAEVERLRQALTRIAERDNWQISEPDCYGGTNYEWIGDGGEAFEIAAAALLPEAPEGG